MGKKKKGYTIIEIMITLSITVTILGVIYSLDIASRKIFNSVNVKSTLQIEAENAGDKIGNAAMEGVKITEITLRSGDIEGFGTDSEPKYLELSAFLKDAHGQALTATAENYEKFLEISSIKICAKEEIPGSNPIDTKDVYYTIKHVPTGDENNKAKPRGKLTIQKDDGAEQVIAENVENITIKPDYFEGKLSQAGSVQFNLNLAKKEGFSDIKYSIPINIVFRNK